MKDVTIIIPCYNEARFIKQAILSAVSQAEYVLVSDNNSTDGTQEICKELATQYSNLIYFEQDKNIGSSKNGEFLLTHVKTKYLLGMGAHDVLSENYVSELKKALENHPEAVLSYSPYCSIDDDGKILEEDLFDEFSQKLVSKNVTERVLTITQNRNLIFTIFGLINTQLHKKHWSHTDMRIAGSDHLLLSYFISEGTFIRVPEVRFYRRVITRSESPEAFMKRMTGDDTQCVEYDLSYMCSQQFELLKSKSNLEEQERVLNEFSLSMQKIYGNHCRKSLDETLIKLSLSNEKYIVYGAGTKSDYIIEKLPNKILFIVDQDQKKHNTIKNGIEIKSPAILNQYKNKIIISLLNRFELVSNSLVSEYDITPSRLVLPIDYSYKILN